MLLREVHMKATLSSHRQEVAIISIKTFRQEVAIIRLTSVL